MSTLGADVLRLWVAATDYANEISVSDEILKRTSDSYRRVRNTVRFLLGNLAGFDPARDAVPVDQMLALDRWALARTCELQHEVVAAYRSYEFHVIYQKLHNFCVVDLGGFYLDVLKDRLYTTPATGPGANSCAALRLSDTILDCSLLPDRRRSRSKVWCSMSSVRGSVSPAFSATARYSSGITMPSSGSIQRLSAS
mgnify:CR=1 FL=1